MIMSLSSSLRLAGVCHQSARRFGTCGRHGRLMIMTQCGGMGEWPITTLPHNSNTINHSLCSVTRYYSNTAPLAKQKKRSGKKTFREEHFNVVQEEGNPLMFQSLWDEGHGLFMCNMIADTNFTFREAKAAGLINKIPEGVDPYTGEVLDEDDDDPSHVMEGRERGKKKSSSGASSEADPRDQT